MVQLKSRRDGVIVSPAMCFNSCMVQLKLTISVSVSITPSEVLIPVWCN